MSTAPNPNQFLTSRTLWTLAFVVVTPLMILAPALFTTEVVVQSTKLPVSQLAELIIPFLGIAIFYAGMIGAFLNQQTMNFPRLFWLMVSFLLLGMLAIGQGIHFSAQTLNHFVITNSIFGELRDVAYLFNERLTHLIWLPAVLSFPTVAAGWEVVSSRRESGWAFNPVTLLLGAGAGGWYGLVTGFAVLEAQLAKFAISGLLFLLVSGFLITGWRKKLFHLGSIINLVSLTAMLGIIVLWRLKFGGFPEPLDVLR